MEKLIINTGLKRYEINDNGAIFSFNPSDINLYARFLKMREKIIEIGEKIEKQGNELNQSNQDEVETFAIMMSDADKLCKQAFSECFGSMNDFDHIFDGVNVFSPTITGNWLITDFVMAITPLIEKEVALFTKEKAKRKAAQVKQNKTKRTNK